VRKALPFICLTIVLAIAAALSYRADDTRGLVGCGIGAAVGGLLIAVSGFFSRRARSSEGNAMLAAVYGGVIASFVILIASMIVVHFLWTEVLAPVTLTAFGLYLVYRFADALSSWPAPRGSGEAAASGGPGESKTVSGTTR